jgi:addiction module HigA family antidote
MYNPAHPGEIFKELMLEPLGLSINEVADHLGVDSNLLTKIIKGKVTITPEIALRFEMTFGKPNAAHWLRLQNAYDLWQIRQNLIHIQVTPLKLHHAIAV